MKKTKEQKARLLAACDAAVNARGTLAEIARELMRGPGKGYTHTHVESLLRNARRKAGTVTTKEENRHAEGSRNTGRPLEHRRFGKEELDALFAKYNDADPSMPAQTMARLMIKDNPIIDYHVIHLGYLVRDWRRKNPQTITIPPPKGLEMEKYRVIDGAYKWKARHGDMEMPVELADQMFYEYSRHGLDLSQSQMRGRHGLKIWEWNSVKNALFLYKDANILSPWTEDNTPREQLEKLVDERMGMKLKDKQRLIEHAYGKETLKRYKEVIEKDARGAFALESMIDELNDTSSEWKSKTAVARRTEDFGTERRWLVVPIADLHVGCRSEGLRITPDYSPEQTRHLLDKAARAINAKRATDVTICLMGDLIESFTGLNHPNTWQNVEYGVTGAKAIKEAMSILEEFIAKVDNVREILGVSGNHDRITSSNKEDTRGQTAEIIFYMLSRLYAGTIPVTYEDLVLSKEIDGIQYILAHGDKRVIKEGKQAVIDHGNPKLFNIILTAHKHSRKTIQDEHTLRWIGLPAIFTGNRYSEENAWHARAGFQTFENDGSGFPIQTDHTIG